MIGAHEVVRVDLGLFLMLFFNYYLASTWDAQTIFDDQKNGLVEMCSRHMELKRELTRFNQQLDVRI